MFRKRTSKQDTSRTLRTKRGGVSLYVVVFLTLMFGVIALGFIRIVLNDAKETSNTDLYNSAYDSALAGLEDAKIALLKYHDCLNQGATPDANANSGSCPYIIYAMEKGVADESCNVVQDVLGRQQDSEKGVIIQETQNESDSGSTAYMEQAYTCVKITERTPNYLTTLTSSDSTRIIPLHSSELQNVTAIELGWYSQANASEHNASFGRNAKYMSNNKLNRNTSSEDYAPPVITFELFQADTVGGNSNCRTSGGVVPVTASSPCFSTAELSVNNTDNSGTDHALLLLYPVNANGSTFIDSGTVLDHSDKSNNDKISVNCSQSNDDFYCRATIQLPPTFNKTQRAAGASFVKVSLPYNRPNTDISLYFCDAVTDGKCTSTKMLTGVQAAVDSTGRANDLYRRVESRIELVDLYYPYAEYGLHVQGRTDINKSFYVTRNCWESKDGDGSAHDCKNSDYI